MDWLREAKMKYAENWAASSHRTTYVESTMLADIDRRLEALEGKKGFGFTFHVHADLLERIGLIEEKLDLLRSDVADLLFLGAFLFVSAITAHPDEIDEDLDVFRPADPEPESRRAREIHPEQSRDCVPESQNGYYGGRRTGNLSYGEPSVVARTQCPTCGCRFCWPPAEEV
jgi:hypothetical protein